MDSEETIHQDMFDEKLSEIRRDIPVQIEALENLMAHYDPFNIIANVSLRQHVNVRGQGKQEDMEPMPVVAEYIALLYLKYPYCPAIGELTRARELPGDIQKITELATDIVYRNSLLLQTSDKFDFDNDVHQISHALGMEEYFVRNPAVDEHHWIVFEEIFKPFDGPLWNKFGFNTLDAMDLCGCIHEFLQDRFSELRKEFTGVWMTMFEEVFIFKKKGKRPQNFYPHDVLMDLSKFSERELKLHFIHFAEARMATILGERLSFTVPEMAEYAGIDASVVARFLDLLSIDFGSVSDAFSAMEIITPLKDQPIIRHEGRYLCPSISLLDYAVERHFTKFLLVDKPKFTTVRHDFVLDKAIALLQNVLANSISYTKLTYFDGKNAEMDGLILYDNTHFLSKSKVIR